MSDVRETDVVVGGLGAVGTGVLSALDRRGARVIGIDRYRPPHDMGSSHGLSRITREFVGEGAAYVPLVRRSHEIWDELQRRGARLRERTGLLYLSRRGGGARRHHADDFVEATRAVARAAGVTMPELDARALRARYPQFAVADDAVGYLEPEGGFVRPERCIEAQLAALCDPASSLVFGETILEVREANGGVLVTTDKAAYRARRAVLATGAWTPGLVGGAFGELRVLRQVQYWFELTDAGLWRGAPTFLWFHGDGPADVFYGFPPDGGGVKVATEQYETACDPDLCDREVSAGEAAAMFEAHVRGRLNGVGPALQAAAACLYTYNGAPGREGRFMIGPHPGVPGVTVVSACSGHGFKHAAGLGEAIAAQVLGETPFCDLGPFMAERR